MLSFVGLFSASAQENNQQIQNPQTPPGQTADTPPPPPPPPAPPADANSGIQDAAAPVPTVDQTTVESDKKKTKSGKQKTRDKNATNPKEGE